jgi:hypothetical protein
MSEQSPELCALIEAAKELGRNPSVLEALQTGGIPCSMVWGCWNDKYPLYRAAILYAQSEGILPKELEL